MRETSPLSRLSDGMSSWRLRSPVREPEVRVSVPDECGMLRLVLGVTAPYKIRDASEDLLDLFQLSAAQCIGRNVGVLSGPDTNTQTFGELMKAVGMGKRARAVLMLYSCSGAGERFCVSAQPYFAPSGELTSALLEMQPCKAPTLKMAAQDDGRAKAIVEASQPFRAVFCSPEFEALYGLAEPMVLGRTLNLIHGPTTDQRTWVQVLTAATQGTPGNAQLVTATSDCREVEVKIEVQPIVNAAGYISHLLITFLRLRPYRQPLPPHHDFEYGLHQSARQNASSWDMPSPATIPDSKLPGDGQLWNVPQLMASSAIAAAPRSTWSGYQGQQMDMMSTHTGRISVPAHDRDPFAPPAHRREAELHGVILPQTPQLSPFPEQGLARLDGLVGMVDPLAVIPENTRCCTLERSHFDFNFADPSYGMPPPPLKLEAHHSNPPAHDLQPDCGRPPAARVQGVSTVIPRRKAGQAGGDVASPVSITIETLERYSSVPLSKAAILLGISSTAMKKACRKLGLTRWPYTTPSRVKLPPPLPKSSVTTQVDSAYVRKLFRKYSGHARIRDFDFGGTSPVSGGGAGGCEAGAGGSEFSSSSASTPSEAFTPCNTLAAPDVKDFNLPQICAYL